MNEEWRPVVGWEDRYAVSDWGRVKRVAGGQGARKGHIRKLSICKQGYKYVGLQHNKYRKTYKVHRLVAAAFIGPCPDGHEVNHKNGVKDDNRPANLEYVTPLQNTRHAMGVLGRIGPRGERSSGSKLTEKQVIDIRVSLNKGGQVCAIANEYGVSRMCINRIKYYKSWAYLQETA